MEILLSMPRGTILRRYTMRSVEQIIVGRRRKIDWVMKSISEEVWTLEKFRGSQDELLDEMEKIAKADNDYMSTLNIDELRSVIIEETGGGIRGECSLMGGSIINRIWGLYHKLVHPRFYLERLALVAIVRLERKMKGDQ
jgi:hypothetical protein